jgi:uncharacterized membrane protein SpoIIM required for sporulation
MLRIVTWLLPARSLFTQKKNSVRRKSSQTRQVSSPAFDSHSFIFLKTNFTFFLWGILSAIVGGPVLGFYPFRIIIALGGRAHDRLGPSKKGGLQAS